MDRTFEVHLPQRLVAVALVAAVGLVTQFVVERSLPPLPPAGPLAAGRSNGSPWAPGLAWPASEWAPASAGQESAAGSDGAGSLAAPEERAPEAGDDEGWGAAEHAPRMRTRTRRYLPAPGLEGLHEPVELRRTVALGAAPAGWIDLAAPLRETADESEPETEIALLVPSSIWHFGAPLDGLESELEIALELPAEHEAECDAEGRVLVIRDRTGRRVAERERPSARDGQRRRLPARFEVREGRARIVLDARDALPPIEVHAWEPAEPRSVAPEPKPERPSAPASRAKTSSDLER